MADDTETDVEVTDDVDTGADDRVEIPEPPGDDADAEAWKAYAEAWKASSRKWERSKRVEPEAQRRRAREAEKRAAALEKKLAEREQADMSEQERAIAQAREEARNEALSTAEKERRQDRLELAATRLGVKPFTVGDGDDKQTVRFADPDDALVYLERAIAKGDLDADDIFDDEGKVQTDALTNALAEILESKPHLRAGAQDGNGNGRFKGDPDAGKGKGGSKSLEAMSVEDHARRKYGNAA